MATFTMVHELDCDVDRFWKVFFDQDVTARLYREELEFPSWAIVEEKETDREIIRTVKATPKSDMPAAVVKLVGSGFFYVEDGRFDKASKTFRWTIKPSALESKLRQEGNVRAEAAGPNKTRRIVEIVVEAKVFGIGGMIESSVEKGLRGGWNKSARFINDWLKANPAG
jgi:hypothetical protein